jgi:hypothetical protein
VHERGSQTHTWARDPVMLFSDIQPGRCRLQHRVLNRPTSLGSMGSQGALPLDVSERSAKKPRLSELKPVRVWLRTRPLRPLALYRRALVPQAPTS